MNELADICARIESLEAAVFRRMPQPEGDGWITNAHKGDTATHDMLMAEYGGIRLGEPKATPARTAAEIAADDIVGVYLVRAKGDIS